MNAIPALFAQLSNDGAVGDLVGSSNAARIFPKISPQALAGSYPQIVYEITDSDQARHYTGSGGLYSFNGTLFCIADSYAGVIALADAMRAALDNRNGTWGGVAVQGCFIDEGNEGVEETGDQGEQRILYVKELRFLLWIQG
jgi:hypothetical protein